ncbi:MAG TPA: filamentous hemagglutinin N-terminal domain-containing protein [Caulobacteraceae bacterium]
MTHPRPIRRRHEVLLAAAAPVALALALAAGPARAANNTPVPATPPPASGSNWSGATVAATYDPTATVNTVTVTAPRAYAEWHQFNVTTGSSFNVSGPLPDWILVNRVVDIGAANISDLSGAINSEGQVWLINPNGIVASQTGLFNVGGLLLSTATGFDVSGFLAGSSLTWTFTGATQPIVMNGTVIATQGVVALLAPQITVGDGTVGSGAGNVFEAEPGTGQFVAIAAEDVSLTFAEDGNLLYQLDGATIEKGVAGAGPGIVGGVLLNTSSTIVTSRIFVAAGGQTAPADVVVTGSVTATEARVEGDDIVLMTTDLAPAGSPQIVADAHIPGGSNGTVHDGSFTATGGYVLLAPQNVNTVEDPQMIVDPSAALGASVTVRSAGTVILGNVTNPVGDLDIKANGHIIPVLLQGNLSAVDIALESGNDITVGALNARDDVVVRGSGGFAAGDINAGVTVLGLSPTDPSVTIASEAGERLVERANPIIFSGYGFDLVGHDVDVRANHIDIGATTATDDGPVSSSGAPPYSDVRLQTFGLSASNPLDGDVATGALTAPRDVFIDAYGDVSATDIVAGRDFAANSVIGDVRFSSADAQDDIVLGAGGGVFVSGDLTTHGLDSAAPYQVGDLLSASGPVVAYSPAGPGQAGGATFNVTGSDIDILAGSIRIGGTSLAQGSGSDARFQATGAIALHAVTASQDILIDAGQGVVAGDLTAGRDVAARSFTASVITGAIDAQDDAVLRAAGAITVNRAITTHGKDSSDPDQSGDLLVAAAPMNAFSAAGPGQLGGASFDLTGSDIDVKAGGSIVVTGVSDAVGVEPDLGAPNTSDARYQAGGAISLAGVNAGQDALIDAAQAVNVDGALLAGRDIAVRSQRSSIDVTGVTVNDAIRAGDDIVLRAGGSISVTGRLATYANDPSSPGQAGDLLAAVDPIVLHGVAFGVGNGPDIDVRAGGSILIGPNSAGLSGFGSAYGGTGSDVRFQAGGAITLNDVVADEDLLLDAGQAIAVDVELLAGRDVAVRSTGASVTVGAIDAGDDAVVRAAGAVSILGTITSGSGANAQGVGDLLATADPISAYWAASPDALTTGAGGDLDVRAGGAITLSGLATANGAGSDIRLDSGGLVTIATLGQQGGVGGEQVLIAAADLALGGQINAPSADVLLFARRSSLLAGGFAVATLGGPAASGAGFTFDNTEVSRTRAASLNLFSGIDPAASSGVAIEDLQYTANLRTVRVYAGQGERVDVTGQVTDPVGTDGVLVIGAAGTDPQLPAFTLGSGAPTVSTAWTPDVIRLSGGIGVTGNAFSRVSLAATTIFIAPTGDTALGADFETASQTQAPEAMAPYAGPSTLQLRAGQLVLRASNAILERNLQPTSNLIDGRGLELGALTIDRLSASGSVPSRVSLFGRLDSQLSGVLPPPAPDTFIDEIAAAYLLRFAPQPGAAVAYPSTLVAVGAYRFNTCPFGGGGCLQGSSTGGLGGLGGGGYTTGGVPGGPGGPGQGDGGLEGAGQEAGLPGIANPGLIDQAMDPFAPVEEEPVTNTAGEVEWPAPSTPERKK